MKPIKRLRTRLSLKFSPQTNRGALSVTMYDSIEVGNLPRGATAYAGYVAGEWPTWNALVSRYANIALLLSVDPFGTAALAHCLDCENGDATNADVLPWFRRMKAAGVSVPVVYTSAGNVQKVINILMGAGYTRTEFLIWSAHYTYRAHICAPAICGYAAADGTQWSDEGPGGCDVSLLPSYFFPWTLGTFTPNPTPKPDPTPVPVPVEEEDPMPVALPPGSTSPHVGVSFNGAPYTTVGFLGDPSVVAASTCSVRCAFHSSKTNSFTNIDATLTPASPKVVVQVPADSDGVSFTRLDDVQLTLYPNFS